MDWLVADAGNPFRLIEGPVVITPLFDNEVANVINPLLVDPLFSTIWMGAIKLALIQSACVFRKFVIVVPLADFTDVGYEWVNPKFTS